MRLVARNAVHFSLFAATIWASRFMSTVKRQRSVQARRYTIVGYMDIFKRHHARGGVCVPAHQRRSLF